MPRSLPATPTIEALKKQAKQVLKAHKDGNVSCCATLKLLSRFKGKSDAEVFNAALKLSDAQFALALDYGFESWPQLKKFLDSSAKVKQGVILNWRDIVVEKPNCRIKGIDLVVENPKGKESALHVEFGGMSWDNYRLGVDALIEKSASQNMVAANVQLCPRGTCVYCQIFGDVGRWNNGINLWHWDIEGKKEIQVAHMVNAIALNTWNRFEIVVKSPSVGVFFNGEQVIDKRLAVPTYGMPGLIVNYGSDARVRLKNLRIQFFRPTRLQVEEYETDAVTNWTNYKRREIEAGRRKSMDDDSL
ncbi:MAG: DUF1080 domain-containing protein [Kiritimatiellae bacterium]|nr:DUF1080 domain-containing protein [Kiritimatiellia bacterium]